MTVNRYVELIVKNATDSILVQVSWPRIDGKFEGNGFSTRMKAFNKSKLCSNRNFNLASYSEDGYTFVKPEMFSVSGKSYLYNSTLDNRVNLLLNFTDMLDPSQVVKTANFSLSLNTRSHEVIQFNSTDFEFDDNKKIGKLDLILTFGVMVISGLGLAFLCCWEEKQEDEGEGSEGDTYTQISSTGARSAPLAEEDGLIGSTMNGTTVKGTLKLETSEED